MTEAICEGRVCIVTGAGRGLGREYALLLAHHGAKVVVNDLGASRDGSGLDAGPAAEVVDEIEAAGGEAIANTDDISSWDGAAGMIQQAIDTFGGLDVLVNNAGILRDRMLFSMSEEEWDSVIQVHLKGTFAPSHHAAEYWRNRSKDGETNDARLINTTSVSGLYANPGQTNYGAAKAGIAAFTQIAAQELGRYGVTANAIAPGALTRLTEDLAMPDEMTSRLLRRVGRPGRHLAGLGRLRRRHRPGDRVLRAWCSPSPRAGTAARTPGPGRRAGRGRRRPSRRLLADARPRTPVQRDPASERRSLDHRRRPHPARQGPPRRRAARAAPAGAAGPVPARAGRPHRVRPRRGRRRRRRQRHPLRATTATASAGMAMLAAGLARDGSRHDPQPLLRLGPAGRDLRRHGRGERPPGPRGRRRRRVDVALGPSTAGRPTIDGGQPGVPRPVPDGAPGHLRRPDRHHRGLHPRPTSTRSRREPGARRGRHGRGPLRPQRHRRSPGPTVRWCSTVDEYPRAGTTVERLAELQPAFEAMGADRSRGRRPSFDEHVHAGVPAASTTSTTCTTPATRRASSTARRPCSSASDAWVKANGVTPRARIGTTAAVGSEPVIMLTAPGPSSQRCLAKAGMTVGDIDLWEINEAFAAVP